jgi:hypothetical protein
MLPEFSYESYFSMLLFVVVTSFSSAYFIMILVEYPFGNLLKTGFKAKKLV